MAAATIRTQPASQHTSAQQQLDSRAPQQQQPQAQHMQQQQQQEPHSEGQSDDEGELQHLRLQRLRQLQAESAVKQEQRREGFGVLNTVMESSVLVSSRCPCLLQTANLCMMRRGNTRCTACQRMTGIWLHFQHDICTCQPRHLQQKAYGLCLSCIDYQSLQQLLTPTLLLCLQKLCCQDPPGRGLVVLHLAVQGYEPCNALDECLEQAADQYRCAAGCRLAHG
jgi:hypothetical protein